MKKNINQGREEGRKVEGGTEMNRQEGIDQNLCNCSGLGAHIYLSDDTLPKSPKGIFNILVGQSFNTIELLVYK